VLPKLTVQVLRRMYCFQASEPDSRPPPVSFSPPKAPPISAPLVPMLVLTRPQSLPRGPIHLLYRERSRVKRLELRPCGTLLLIATASSKVENLIMYKMGTKSSLCRIGALESISMIVGCTKLPSEPSITSPPARTFPPWLCASAIPLLNISI